jgi:hypothetical protein
METRGNLEKLSEGKVHILTRSATNTAMHTKLDMALQFNLEEYTIMTWKDLCTTSGTDLQTNVSLAAVKDLVEEICG